MSINQSFGQTKGNYPLNSIDFNINEAYNQSDYKNNTKNYCGELNIQGMSFKMTLKELERLSHTLDTVREVLYKKHKLGIMIK